LNLHMIPASATNPRPHFDELNHGMVTSVIGS
jgi:hypothetical protein